MMELYQGKHNKLSQAIRRGGQHYIQEPDDLFAEVNELFSDMLVESLQGKGDRVGLKRLLVAMKVLGSADVYMAIVNKADQQFIAERKTRDIAEDDRELMMIDTGYQPKRGE